MEKQPEGRSPVEALRLADALQELDAQFSFPGMCGEAAAELRRLHEECQRLTGEVANRNRRALEGNEAVAALDRVHSHYEGQQARIAALENALGQAVEALEMWRAGPFDSATRGGCISRSNFALTTARQTLK